MHSFKDNAQRTWKLDINVASMRQVRKEVNVDLFKLLDGGFAEFAKLTADPVAFVDVLGVLIADQLKAANVSDEDFFRAMGGDTLADAAEAMLEELIDFFPDRRVRNQFRTAVGKGKKLRDRMLTNGERMLEAIDPEAEADRLSGPSTNSPASSASTPAPTPSES